MNKSWICCQIGAREHYAVPRSLIKNGNTVNLFTDFWASPSTFNSIFLTHGLQQRYCRELDGALVHSFNLSSICFEIIQRTINNNGWKRTLARNSWFQRQALKRLKHLKFNEEQRPVLFSYSYAALELFRYAKSEGWTTILGQIDPGPIHEKIVSEEKKNRIDFESSWENAPSCYWENWRAECLLADKIVVNSDWSKDALIKVQIPAEKIETIPLVYKEPEIIQSVERIYPDKFSNERPLSVLFLGAVALGKGITALLEAVELLHGEPVEFLIVGRREIELSEKHQNNKQIKWIGQVSRSETEKYYRDSDIFLFPSLSDGFGLTQLEAQYWKLPVIASRYCGQVVEDGVNGFLLDKVSGEGIANVLRKCLSSPELVQKMSDMSSVNSEFSLSGLSTRLEKIVNHIESTRNG